MRGEVRLTRREGSRVLGCWRWKAAAAVTDSCAGVRLQAGAPTDCDTYPVVKDIPN